MDKSAKKLERVRELLDGGEPSLAELAAAPGPRLVADPPLADLAATHGKTPAQVLIRWHIQLGNIVIPKSVNPERIASNFNVFDFELNEADIASIATLDDGTRLGPDPRTFNFTG